MDNFGRYEAPRNAASPENYPLKWHKFLIYFALWAGALVNASTALMCIQGRLYEGQSEQIYTAFSGMRIVDLAWGIILLGICAYMIYVRFQLAGFRIGAPGKLSILYGINIGASLLYLIAVSAVTRISLRSVLGDIAISLIGSILMLFINQNYYSKRLELFVN